MTLEENIAKLLELYKNKQIDSTIPLMSLFSLNGKPYSLRNHWMLEGLFDLARPKRRLLKCARQIGKSQQIGGQSVLDSLINAFFRALIVTPRFNQVQRLSKDIIGPFIDQSHVRDSILPKGPQSIFRRSFITESILYFAHAFLNPDSIRGLANIAHCIVDECQDIRWEFIPIIGETMSANEDFGFYTFTGTPKTVDNTIELLWQKSSQGEWCTKCEACNTYNIASLDADILKMIGKDTVICHKCGRPINCVKGFYVHKYPERRSNFVSWHVPQIIHPLHTNKKHKWHELLYKMENYPQVQFYNECLGESWDSSAKLITMQELISATDMERENSIASVGLKRQYYHTLVLGIDWSGGGNSVSFTKLALGGVKSGTDTIDILYTERFSKSLSPLDENALILERIKQLQPHLIAHDYGGAGNIREMGLLHAGIPSKDITPFTYVCSYDKDIITYSGANMVKSRDTFNIDKARSLSVLCLMMKAGKVTLPAWNTSDMNSDMLDFIHLQEDVQENISRSDVYRVVATPGTSDDLAHAVNYVCSSIWLSMGNYPNLQEAMKYKVTKEQFNILTGGHIDVNIDTDSTPID